MFFAVKLGEFAKIAGTCEHWQANNSDLLGKKVDSTFTLFVTRLVAQSAKYFAPYFHVRQWESYFWSFVAIFIGQ